MIDQPVNWRMIGNPVSVNQVEHAILASVADIDCADLAFSGGVDSCLLLHYMLSLGRKVRTFTMACQSDHPDIAYAERALKYFEKKFGGIKIESVWGVRPNLSGDDLVKAFYDNASQFTDSMIAGDGIDEFMCGYYAHQTSPTEAVYFDFLRRIQVEQLEPLNENSGKVKVHLPYLDERVTSLLWQIPLSQKVDRSRRKKIIYKIARGRVPEEVLERRKYGFGTVVQAQKRTSEVREAGCA